MNKQQIQMIRFAKNHDWCDLVTCVDDGVMVYHRTEVTTPGEEPEPSCDFFTNIDELRLWAGY